VRTARRPLASAASGGGHWVFTEPIRCVIEFTDPTGNRR
jgi:hypothetical protein